MSTSEPFLNPTVGDLICLICGDAISLKSVSKGTVQHKKDVSQLKTTAVTWKEQDIPNTDTLFRFMIAHARIAGRTNGYVNKNCQINFRTKSWQLYQKTM